MIKSLENKKDGSLLALEGLFVRFNRYNFRSYKYPFSSKVLHEWGKKVSTPNIKVVWCGDYFLTQTEEGEQIHYYTPLGLDGLMNLLKQDDEYVVRQYRDDSDVIVLESGIMRA